VIDIYLIILIGLIIGDQERGTFVMCVSTIVIAALDIAYSLVMTIQNMILFLPKLMNLTIILFYIAITGLQLSMIADIYSFSLHGITAFDLIVAILLLFISYLQFFLIKFPIWNNLFLFLGILLFTISMGNKTIQFITNNNKDD
jgi:lysylphosphatidylglycerol synthetase-like protein (DUF2156 family)